MRSKEKLLKTLASIVFLFVLIPSVSYGGEHPLHKDNFPPTKAYPIDGIWEAMHIGHKAVIDRGRMMYFNEALGPPEFVFIKDIKRVAPGKYRGTHVESENKMSDCTLSVVDKDKIIIRGDLGDYVYYKVRLINETWFLEDYKKALQEAAQKRKSSPASDKHASSQPMAKASIEPSLLIHSIEIKPQRVHAGSKFDFTLEYSVTDTSVEADHIPAMFSYSILQNEKVLFNSKPVTIEIPNGERMSRIVHLAAAKKKGLYKIRASIQYKSEMAEKSAEFDIAEDIDHDVLTQETSEIKEATITKALESSAQIEDFLITKGPSLIAQGQYNRVLTLIDYLPGITRTNTQIRTLECFANLKGWVSEKNRLCKKNWWELRQTLIQAGDNEATLILVTILRDGDPYVRMYAAELLGYIGDKRALKDLKKVWENDENKSVKKYAKWAYTLISRKKF